MITEFEKLCAEKGIEISVKRDPTLKIPSGFRGNVESFKVTLKFQGRKLSTPFFQGSAHTSEPKAAGVLYCLINDARAGEMEPFEFFEEMGFVNAKDADRAYKACKMMARKLPVFLDEDFDKFVEASSTY